MFQVINPYLLTSKSIFIDGTVETGNGFCTQPYPDPSKGYGIANWDQNEVDNITLKANDQGLSMHVHTMGDAAVKRAVDAPNYQTMADYNIYVTSGMLWHHMSPSLADLMEQIVPANLVQGYPIKSFFDNGITVSF